MMKRKQHSIFIGAFLFLYTLFCTFNQYFKILSIPIFYFPLSILIVYSVILSVKKKTISTIEIIFAIWIFYAIILTFLNSNSYSIKYLLLLFLNISGFWVINKICDDNISYFLYCQSGLKFGLIINIIIGFWEAISKNHIKILTDEYERRFQGTPVTFYANANDLSVILISLVIIIIFEMLLYKKKSKTYTSLIISICAYIIVLKTGSTIGLFSIPFILILSFIFFYANKYKLKKLIYIFSFLALLLIIISIKNNLSLNTNYVDNIRDRLPLWASALHLFTKSWGFGIGPGQNMVLGAGQVHFYALEVLSEYGAIIFILFIYIYVRDIKLCNILSKANDTCINDLVLSFLLVIIILSISTSSMTKLFPVWNVLAILHFYINHQSSSYRSLNK